MVSDLPPFVSAGWLAENIDHVALCDVRMRPDAAQARREFEAGHLPGARFVDLNSDLAAPPAEVVGRHPLHDPVIFAALMGLLGIGPDTPVVAYDNSAGALAARLVWMLRATGTPAAVLEGGSGAWSGPLETGDVEVVPVERPVIPWPDELLATAEDVATATADGVPLIDSRASERFRGETEPLDKVAGHIPGAVNLPFASHLENGLLIAPERSRGRLAAVGFDGEGPAPIVYCGSGVTACVNLLIAEHVGLGRGRLYVGSWSGWSTSEGAEIA